MEFIFNIGEEVVYTRRGMFYGSKCVILERFFEKDYFLSQTNRAEVYYAVYITEETIKSRLDKTKARRWEDRELFLISADISKPEGATDYASDEYEADFLDIEGNVLKTIKSGKTGEAHKLVSSYFG